MKVRAFIFVYLHAKDEAGAFKRHFDAVLPQTRVRNKLRKRKNPTKRQRKIKQQAIEA
jgi:hypothetical protein